MPWAIVGFLSAILVAVVLSSSGTSLTVILAILVIGIGVIAERAKAKAMRFRVRIWDNGVLEVVDKASVVYPIGQVVDAQVVVAGRGAVERKSLALSHAAGQVRITLPTGIGYYYGGPSLTSSETGMLVDAIRHHAGLPLRGSTPAPTPLSQVVPQPPVAAVGGGSPVSGGWTWRHPDADALGRRRTRWFAVSGALVLILMGVAGYAERDADTAGLILSVLFAPGLLALLLFGSGWFFYVRPRRFALAATPDGTIHAGGSRRRSGPLAAAAAVDVALVTATTHQTSGTVTSRTWQLTVRHPAAAKPFTVVLPGGGFGARLLTEQEAQQLEQELRHLAGLPSWWSTG